MAALPPDFKEDDGEPQAPQLPQINFVQMPQPSFKDTCWYYARGFALFLALTALGAYVAMLCWNTLTALTTLPEINWQEAFCALILLRVAALAALPN